MNPLEKESSYCWQNGRSVEAPNKICTFNLASSTKSTWNKSEWWITPNIFCWSRSYCPYKTHHIRIFIRCSESKSILSNAIIDNKVKGCYATPGEFQKEEIYCRKQRRHLQWILEQVEEGRLCNLASSS